MANPRTLEERIARLEDLEAIRTLVARYGFAIDDRDIAAVADLFTNDGRFRSTDGVMDASGRQAVLAQFEGRFAALGPTNHFTHDHVIRLDDAAPGTARGLDATGVRQRERAAVLEALQAVEVLAATVEIVGPGRVLDPGPALDFHDVFVTLKTRASGYN
jgi:hypothetical protein